jgi:hypothetical protein
MRCILGNRNLVYRSAISNIYAVYRHAKGDILGILRLYRLYMWYIVLATVRGRSVNLGG